MNRSTACRVQTSMIKASALALFLAGSPVQATAVKDAEAASHGDTAATQTFVKSYEFPGVKIMQYNLAVLSHYSYFCLLYTSPSPRDS